MPNFRGTPRKLLSPLELIVHLVVPLDRTRQSNVSDNINPLIVHKHITECKTKLENNSILNLPSSSSFVKSRGLSSTPGSQISAL